MGGQTDVVKQIPYYIRDFWYVILLFVAVVYLMNKWYAAVATTHSDYSYSKKHASTYGLVFILTCSLTVLGLRGGFQRVPIDFADAGYYTRPQNVSLILNTPFTLIKSLSHTEAELYNFTSDKIAFESIQPIKQFNHTAFKSDNIVILMLESFSKEYTGIGNRKSITPFLDSLMSQSLVFTNAWANGTKSIEGIPAILASIPALTNDPFINSSYCNNSFTSFASILKTKNYYSAFFHGGINGTMNFDVFAKQAGFDKYYGKNEYNNDADFDGNWGIWDEPYLQYCAKTINTFKTPFFSSIFTLSSHHPYKIPEKYKGKFAQTELENSESIGYADYALRKFFETASKMPWFANTTFVLVADHASISSDPFYANTLGQHAIPILFYKSDNSFKGINQQLIEQIDILPTLLDTLGFNESFFSFGKSAFSPNLNNSALFYDSGNQFLINDSLFLAYNNFNPVQKIRFRNDSVLAKNLPSLNTQTSDNYLKSFMQVHNYCILKNKMTVQSVKSEGL